MKKVDFSNTIVFGTGYSVDTFFKKKDYLNVVDSNTTVSFQAAFYFAYKKYNFIPDVWTWSDPHSAIEGLQFLLENKKLFTSNQRKLHIFIPNFVDTCFRNKHHDFCGTSPVWRDINMENFYYRFLFR